MLSVLNNLIFITLSPAPPPPLLPPSFPSHHPPIPGIIRDYALADHTTKYERMAAIDQVAHPYIRKVSLYKESMSGWLRSTRWLPY